jgi:hypothetical protein
MGTEELATPFRNLEGIRIVLAKLSRPIRNQDRVAGTRNLVLRYAQAGSEEA